MKLLWLGLLLFSLGTASAQVEDREEQKSRLYLYQLSKDIHDLEECSRALKKEEHLAKLWPLYYRRVNEFVSEIDAHVKKYSSRRTKDETVDAFRFRVWQVALMVGSDEKRQPRGTGAYICQALIL